MLLFPRFLLVFLNCLSWQQDISAVPVIPSGNVSTKVSAESAVLKIKQRLRLT